jgi:trigger factor
MSVGEERDFGIVLSEDYKPEQYAGKTLQCHVELVRLEHRTLPAIDDAFAQSVGEFETLEALRGRVRETLEAQQRSSDAESFVSEVSQRTVDAASVEIPPPMIDDEIHRMIDNLRSEVESRQQMTFDLYLRLVDKTEEQLHEDFHASAEARVKSNLVLEALADAEGLVPPREQVDAELREVASLPTVRERDRRRILSDPRVRANVEARLKRRLALQHMLQVANPGGDSVVPDSADTTTSSDDTPKEDASQEAAQSPVGALEGSPSHAGEEES